MGVWANDERQVGQGEWSSQPTNPDWSEDQTTAHWTPKHVHALRWPARKPARRDSERRVRQPAPGSDISQVVVAPGRRTPTPYAPVQPLDIDALAALLRAKMRQVWLYSATAAVAVFLALMSSHALLGLFGQAGLPRASAAVLPPARVAPVAIKRKLEASLVPQPQPQPIAAAPRQRSAARVHVRTTHAPARPIAAGRAQVMAQNQSADEPLDADVEPDMSFMDAPISAREARAIAEGRARTGAKSAPETSASASAEDEPAPENTQPGTLRINSRPWAQLYLDGRLIGNTPQLGLRVSPGEHSIRLVNPQFVMSKSFSVYVTAGESVTRIESLDE